MNSGEQGGRNRERKGGLVVMPLWEELTSF